MPTDALGRYTPNHKVWDHAGNMIPQVEYSEGDRPHGEWKPAPWLPVQFFDKYYENWMVVTPGKILSCDNDGDLVPCQYNDGSVDIVYTQDDVDQETIDVETGEPVTAPKTVAVSGVTTYKGRSGESLAVSKPLGVAPYSFLQWAGGDGSNPVDFKQHNYNMQHQVALLCDYVLKVPYVPAKTADETTTGWTEDNNVWTSDPLSNTPVAKNTKRTKIEFSGTDKDLFKNQKQSASSVTSSGDWHIDLRTGVLTVWKGTSGAPSVDVTYHHYNKAPTDPSVFASAVSLDTGSDRDLKCGDFVKCDENSNYVKADAADDFKDIVGQVIEIVEHPRGSLDKVHTAFQPPIGTDASGSKPGYKGQMDQMAGSATGGVPSALHYAGGANLMVHINLISR